MYMVKSVLLVCIGNICRSPMGEAFFAAKLMHKSPDTLISSGGLSALVGWPADPMAQALLLEKGLDISAHRAQQASQEILFGADLILTMSSQEQKQIEANYPSIRGRVHRLGKWGGYDIPDPFKRPRSAFEQALVLIEQGVDDWYKTLWN